ncbi:hypothetical protein G5V59_11760 [Nocardioides sp. W3-2-3]|nr:hypothetical protein [Nocardioides convexus]
MGRIFGACGMYPVGFYDLREASPPIPVVSTAFRPIDGAEPGGQPVPGVHLAARGGRPALLRRRHPSTGSRSSSARGGSSPPSLLDLADLAEKAGGLEDADADRFLEPGHRGLRALARAGRPGLVRPPAGDLLGRRGHRWRRLDPHQPPDPAGARHRRPLPPDDRARDHHDRPDPGPSAHHEARRAAAPDVLPRARRAACLPRGRRVGRAR